ncbi:MAG: RIO1 family regulatory kinase/ATPase domain-containing protein [Candidatus Heimdallarchaeaceae archaeon]|jgi:RIO kinase 2
MPISLRGARVLKKLSNPELRTLHMVETLLKKGEYAPKDKIPAYSGYREKDVEIYLSRLNKLDLTQRWTGQFVGYTLTLTGFDVLALNALYIKKIVSGIGRARGVGKESDIYYALDFEEKEIMLKINRTGRASFQQVRKKRDFLEGRYHHSIFFLAELAAKREYEVLSKLQGKKLPIPKVIGNNRHMIAMEIVEGIELVNIQYPKKPIKLLEKIIEFARTLYQKHEIVHADLTEYNIMYDIKKDKMVIIDFPQAVSVDHPEAVNFLTRDFTHLLDFIGKKWGITTDEVGTVIEYITGEKGD